jgi:hypothetical protein
MEDWYYLEERPHVAIGQTNHHDGGANLQIYQQ